MKRIRVVGLTLVAVFALSAIGVSAASAIISRAEFAGKTGSPQKNGFTGKGRAGLIPTLTAGTNTVTCTSETSKGQDGGNGSMGVTQVVVTFEGCEGKNGTKTCKVNSTSQPAGKIVTNELSGTLGQVATKEATSEVALDLAGPSKEFVTLEGTCLTLSPTKVTGELAGEVTPINKKALTGELIFELNGTKQKIKKVCLLPFAQTCASNNLMEPKLTAFIVEATQMTGETITFEEETEVHAA